ncbi:hypothetical protein LJ739_09565 [Aestuariibacter halophilus]|uniref:Porin n=1 Tax=Fluctibacter halophilus TaxID=226011 RepID=A0ABS8G7B7_9ALTE|nr:hypothetical protein [Aestuariibacter halophilus]MCC2616487.1 hypothetical protein [Aestuariibacter halophilus]
MTTKCRLIFAGLALLLSSLVANVQAAEWQGLIQLGAQHSTGDTSFIDSGTGLLRYSEDDNPLQLYQAVLNVRQDIGSAWSVDITANGYTDGDQKLGLTQAQLEYKPLMAGPVKWRGRAGFFYPRMSLENVDVGWLSPYTYTNSYINSWIGEELRIPGLELTLYRPGRAVRSPWSWELHVGAYRGNDPLGTVISWRGFGLHDRQTLNNDRLNFAPYPSVTSYYGLWHPAWVEPFHEIDGRTGFYVGAHLAYFNQSELRYYYYDNNANPNAVNDQRLYAWDTRFHSLAWQHDFSNGTRLIGQWMSGSTLMGQRYVYADFDSVYIMLTQRFGDGRLSVRWERVEVDEDDVRPDDPNDSDGHAWTLAWRQDISEHWQWGVEWQHNTSRAANRPMLDVSSQQDSNAARLTVQYRIGAQ